MSGLERRAVQRLVDRANGLGVEVPHGVGAILCGGSGGYAAKRWAQEHPGEEMWCCFASAEAGGDSAECSCWRAVYEVEQAVARPPSTPEDIEARAERCGDCAFRPGSPELSSEFTAEELLQLAGKGEPFFCHDGMRRPAKWVHPAGHEVPGDPDDYRPAIRNGMPYRADGRPGLLCAGWAAQSANLSRQGTAL